MKHAMVVCAMTGCCSVQAQNLIDELVWPQGLFSRAVDVGYAGLPGSLSHHPGWNGTLYPFKDGAGGGFFDVDQHRTIDYETAPWHGVHLRAIYRVDEAAWSNLSNRSYGVTLGYAHGPVTLDMSQQRKRNLIESAGIVAAIDNGARDSMVAANVHLGMVNAYAALGQHKGTGIASWNDTNPYGALLLSEPSTDSRDLMLGLAVKFGATVLMASHSRRDDRAAVNLDSSRFAVGITQRWSRQSEFYAAYAKVKSPSAPDRAGSGAFNIGWRFGF
jgi:predicted porin